MKQIKLNKKKAKKKPHLNLKIDKIFINGVEQAEGILQANQAAFVVSQKVELKANQIGFLASKNKFDEKGLLTICSKTVHPDYKGRISAQFINIHQEPIAQYCVVHLGLASSGRQMLIRPIDCLTASAIMQII